MKAGKDVARESSSIDWISNLKLSVVALKSASSSVPVPCLPAILEAISTLLDLVEVRFRFTMLLYINGHGFQRVGQNETDLKYLAESAISITTLLTDELKSHAGSPDARLVALCTAFVR